MEASLIVLSALPLCAYLLGSVSSAIIVCRLAGLPDPRAVGSGNPGATNVLRVGGKKTAAITLGGDLLKGLLPVLLGQWFGAPLLIIALTGLAAFVGHLYPLFFNFKGGKGVATLIGVLVGINWALGLIAIATWGCIAAVFRLASLASMGMAALVPFYGWYFYQGASDGLWFTLTLAAMTVMLFWRHRANIRNLLRGREDRFTDTNEAAARQPARDDQGNSD